MKRKWFDLIYGGSGLGKTTYAKGIVLARQSAGGRTICVDPTGDLEPFGHVVSVRQFLELLPRYGPRDPFALVIRPGWGESLESIEKKTKRVLFSVWRAIFDAGNVLALLDETHRWADARRIDDGLSNLVATGRHRCIDLVATVQTPPQLHPIFRGNADAVISFGQPSERYARILQREFFGDADRIGDVLTRLQVGQYLRVETATGQVSRGTVGPIEVRRPALPPTA